MGLFDFFREPADKQAVDETQFVQLADTQVPYSVGAEKLKEGEHYLTVTLKALRLVGVRRGVTKFHGVVHSFATLPSFAMSDGLARFEKITSPDKLKNLDAANVDRVLQLDVPLLGPIPYQGGRLEWQAGLFAVKAADLAAPYVTLLEKLSTVAGVSFIKAAQPFFEPIREGIALLTGSAGNATLEAGLEKSFEPPETGWYLLVRAPRDEVRGNTFRVDNADYRLLDQKGHPVDRFSYMLVNITATKQRTDIALIPELRDAYAEIEMYVRRQKDKEAQEALAKFNFIARTCPDLLRDDAKHVVDRVRQETNDKLAKTSNVTETSLDKVEGASVLRDLSEVLSRE